MVTWIKLVIYDVFRLRLIDRCLWLIEWSVGYADDGADVLPPVTVSIGGNSSYAEVIDGKVVIGQGDAVNLSDVAALQKKAFQKEKLDRSFLSVEPGRVMYHTLIVYSRAHKKSFVAGPKVAFLRMMRYLY